MLQVGCPAARTKVQDTQWGEYSNHTHVFTHTKMDSYQPTGSEQCTAQCHPKALASRDTATEPLGAARDWRHIVTAGPSEPTLKPHYSNLQHCWCNHCLRAAGAQPCSWCSPARTKEHRQEGTDSSRARGREQHCQPCVCVVRSPQPQSPRLLLFVL